VRNLCWSVVIVEDVLLYAESLKPHLKGIGFREERINTVRTAADALEIVTKTRPLLVLVDVQLAGLKNGYALCEELGRLPFRNEMAVIVLTRVGTHPEALRAGADAFVPKYDLQILLAEIEKRLAGVHRPGFPEPTRESLTVSSFPTHIDAEATGVESSHASNPTDALNLLLLKYAQFDGTILGRDWRTLAENAGRDVFFEKIFAGAIGEKYREVLGRANPLHLGFVGDEKLLEVPLEFTYDPRGREGGEYLVLRHPLSRRLRAIAGTQGISPKFLNERLRRGQPLRILLIASNTEPPIPGVDHEIEELHRMLLSWKDDRCYPVDPVLIDSDHATPQRVKDEIQGKSGGHYDIVHYAGHGSFGQDAERSALWFWPQAGRKGTPQPMYAPEIRRVLKESGVKLFYCGACYSGAAHLSDVPRTDDFLGVAASVVKAGVPAAVGFRQALDDEHAVQFAKKFYEDLGEFGDVGTALWKARNELYGVATDEFTWANPVLIEQY